MSILIALYLCIFAAVAPTCIFVLIFYWADRYEREPGWLATVAFLWGAFPAVIASLVGELLLGIPLAGAESSLGMELVESAIVAPFIEEIAKGLALLAIYWFAYHEFDGVLDGLLYGALIGFGFAMTENFLYFIGAFNEGGFGGLTIVIILRTIVFGLNHSFYTALTGLGFGLARTAQSRFARIFWPVAVLSMAIFAHGMHNFGVGVTSVSAAGFMLSLIVALGGFCFLLLTILISWQIERKYIHSELAEEVGLSVTVEEYGILTSRWRNPLWKRRMLATGGQPATNRLQLSTELASRKHRLRRLGIEREPDLYDEIIQLRAQLIQSHVNK
jgi:RsiW-degrading membrane proteinase PrsW (M82 family)